MQLKVFIGYDPKLEVDYQVCRNSILRKTSKDIEIIPIKLDQLQEIYKSDKKGASEFSFTRFLVPYLSDYRGWSVFMDCDMISQIDISEIWSEIKADSSKTVLVCKHDYIPRTKTKAMGEQKPYSKKNWSSLMVFNNKKCRKLTPEYVSQATGQELHQFEWIKESEIGALPLEYNWLVGEYNPNPDAKILHYTLGTPFWPQCSNCDHSEEWKYERSLIDINYHFSKKDRILRKAKMAIRRRVKTVFKRDFVIGLLMGMLAISLILLITSR